MEKFIPYEKLSKKKQRELDRQKRGNWNGISPVTRTVKNAKIYNRQKARKGIKNSMTVLLFCPA